MTLWKLTRLSAMAILWPVTAGYAAIINVDTRPGPAGSSISSIYLDGSSVGNFNGFSVVITPLDGAELLNVESNPSLASTPDTAATFTNPYLQFFEGPAFSILGHQISNSGISYDAGLLGQYIPDYVYFLNNVLLARDTYASYSVVLQDTGVEIHREQGIFGVPEPNAWCLMLCGLLAMWPRRSRQETRLCLDMRDTQLGELL